jgi:hypothetical protein
VKYPLFIWSVWLFLCLGGLGVSAWATSMQDTVRMRSIITDQGVMPYVTLPVFEVMARMPKKLAKQKQAYNRLRNAVYVTYPYAVRASRILKDVGRELALIKDNKKRKAYIESKEKVLKAEFGDKLENLSVYQGKVLMKLIHRETGDNCYEIIKELKGGFNARLYQTVAFFFGGNLKSEFNIQADKDIEQFVREIEIFYSYQ